MIKVATITFHHSHNFGSVLQAYALQESIKKIGSESGNKIDYKIIDLHTPVQKNIYSVLKKNNSVKNIIKNFQALPYITALKKKYKNFEDFLYTNCNLTRRYVSSDDLKVDIPQSDIYISGSDQLWNVRTTDFDSSYYFDFLPDDARRISYAASMGPLMIDWTKYSKEKYAELLKKYVAISVREENTQKMISEISGCNSKVHIDPTLLLTEDEWLKVSSGRNFNNGKYILFYSLEPTHEQLRTVKLISKTLNLPVVITKYCNKYDYFNSFVKLYDSGPADFISLIHNASFVITSSFHGTAFSVLFKKPFFVFNGMKDNRINTLLTKTNLENRSINSFNYEHVLNSAYNVDFSKSVSAIEIELKRSKEYLKNSLGI